MSAPAHKTTFSSALIGMACRFPGAADLRAYWQLLSDAHIAIGSADQRFEDLPPGKKSYGGFVERWADFDPGFFRLTPAEAAAMDPQQRWLMMLAWEALEDAGYLPASLAGKKVGVFIGLSSADYAQWYLQAPQVDMHTITGLAASVAAHRISYFFDFRGPSLVVDTACSSALTAMHLAQEALRTGDCDYALVGAANCILSPLIQAGFESTQALSPTGECTPFGAAANGMVRGEGAGMVFLTRRPEATDRVYAHLRGTAVNQDGLTQGLSAPSARGQKAVVQAAYQRANVDPADLFYIEAHGTGTPLGDPIEARGLAESVGQFRQQHQLSCGIGSVKRQLGHLEAAAGIASVIKVSLSLYYGEIPASLTEPLQASIPFEKYGLRPLTQNYLLKANDRLAGVSAFGFGGGNAHIILEKPAQKPDQKATATPATTGEAKAQLMALSAKTPTALTRQHQRLMDYLSEHPDTDLAALQGTLWQRRMHHRYRASYASNTVATLQQQLQKGLEQRPQGPSDPSTAGANNGVGYAGTNHAVFVFAGMGGGDTQRQLAQSLRQIPACETDFEALSSAFTPYLSHSLKEYLAYEAPPQKTPFDQSHQQALTFVVQVMLFNAHQRYGIRPRHVVGASMGEITAAYCAGLLPLDAAAELLVKRVRHLQTQIGKGHLAVVGASVDALQLSTYPALEVAGINGPALTIVGGETDRLEQAVAHWQQSGLFARAIPDATAPSHTRWVEDLQTPLLALSQHIAEVQHPSDPEQFPQFWSTVSQNPLSAGERLSTDYWWQNVRACVQLYPTLLALQAASPEPVVFFECNLQSHLSAHLNGHLSADGQQLRMHHCSVNVEAPSALSLEACFLQSAGWFWEQGVSITLPSSQPVQRAHPLRFPLPPYAWDLKTYVHPQTRSVSTTEASADINSLKTRKTLSDADGNPRRQSPPQRSLAQELQEAPASQQLGLLQKHLRAALAEVLQQPLESIAEDLPLKNMGIGSLVGMELYNRIQKELSLQLPLSEILRGPSLQELAQLVLSHLHPQVEELPLRTAPLSPAQLRFWLMDRWLPGLSYHIPVWLQLTGPLDIPRLQQAFVELQERHVLLHTVFTPNAQGQPEQRAVTPSLQWEVLSRPEWNAENIAVQIAQQASKAFDYTQRPPFRVSLFTIDAHHHALLIDMHHLIADGYSFKILFNDLRQLYLGESLAPLSTDFYDYAHSLRSQGQRSAAQTEALSAWTHHLAAVPHFLELPTDYTRPPQLSSTGKRFLFTLEPALLNALEALSKDWGVSTFSLLMAAFQVLVYRASGQQDFIVGTPVLGREQWQWQEVVGPFLNMLPIRSCAQNTSLQAFTQNIHQELLQAFDRQSTPFEHIAEALQPERRADWSPLIQAVLALHAEIPITNFGPIAVEHGEFDLGISRFDLAMTLHPETLNADPSAETTQKRVFRGAVEYRSSLFSESTVAAWVKGFQTLLTQWVKLPSDTALSALSLNPDGAPAGVGSPASHKTQAVQSAWRLWHPVALHAQERPAAVALRYLDAEGALCTVSYQELWRRATVLAERLKPFIDELSPAQTVLATALPAGPELITAWLGISLAGAAYAPLDPHQPQHRLQQHLQSLAPNGLFLAVNNTEGLVTVPAAFCFGETTPIAYHVLAQGNGLSEEPEPLAYVILTSGTTGMPKGVKICHRSVHGLVHWHQEAYGNTQRMAQWANPIFDAASWEIWSAFYTGAELHLLPLPLRHDPLLLHAHLEQQQITQIFLSSAFLSQCFQAGSWSQAPKSLRQILTGGSALHSLPPPAWTVPVFLHYGPTENTVVTSVTPLHHLRQPEEINLGSPLPGQKLYVLDPERQPLPHGFHGQLAISGTGLAAGYVEARTQAKTQSQSQGQASQAFTQWPGAERLYLTGDRVHYREGLYFKGRMDRQLKLRGIRVEAREIEAALCQLPDIQQAFVDLCPSGNSTDVLRAWLVPAGTHTAGTSRDLHRPDSAVLHPQLAHFLPQSLWPQHFHWIAQFPLTPQGKIDVTALHQQLTASQEAFPVATQEQALTAQQTKSAATVFVRLKLHWEGLLKVPSLRAESRFFHSGGHSLLALELQHAVQQDFGLSLALGTLFQNDSLGAMAARIADALSASNPSANPQILPPLTLSDANANASSEPFALTPIQQAYWIGAQTQQRDSVNAQAYLEIHYPSLDLERLTDAVHQLWIRHPMLRMHVTPEGKQYIASVETLKEPWTIQCLNWQEASPETVEKELEALRAQGLTTAPTHTPHFHLVAVQLPASEIKLCIWINALMADASSLMILAQELEQLYLSPERPLPPLSLTFAHWIDYLQQLQQHPLYLAHRQWWLDRLPTLAPPPRLPPRLPTQRLPLTDQKPPSIKTDYGRLSGQLSADQWRQFEALASSHGITPTCLLLSVFTACLAPWNQREAMTLNLTTFSRLPVHPQMQQVVGDFTQLSLLTVTPQPNFWEQTQGVQQALFEVMDHALFSGMEVMRALRMQPQNEADAHANNARFPVVFTSALGYEEYTLPLQGQLHHSQTQTPQVELDHQVMLIAGALHYHWDYPKENGDQNALQQLFDTWQEALQELLRTGTVQDSIHQWPTPAAPAIFSTENPLGVLHLPYLQQSLHHPERVAIITGAQTLSYGSLLQQAYRLAQALERHFSQASPQNHQNHQNHSLRRVALYFPLGAEQVVAVLGVLWAEGTYIPLSMEWPVARLAQILSHADCSTLLCLPEHVSALSNLPAAIHRMPLDSTPIATSPTARSETINTPELTETELRQTIKRLQTQTPQRPAYLIFTSGSTGIPKGVILSHAAVSNTIQAVNHQLQLQSNDRIFGISALSFDLSVYDVFGALWAGAAVVYPDAEWCKEPAHWWQRCQEKGVTLWNSVPGLMEMLVMHGQQAVAEDPANQLALRAVLLSGDWIPLGLPSQIQRLSAEPLAVYSLGGATEGAIWSIWHPIIPSVSVIESTAAEAALTSLPAIPYGTALPAQGVYVLDPWLSEAPIAQTGEIYLAGRGVAEGYLKAPDLNAQHFFRHPHTGEALYRTGDLGYRDAEGVIHLLGRQDQQVKVRGYRIDLSEITQCAEAFTGVRRAVALCVTRHQQKLLALCWEWEPEAVIPAANTTTHHSTTQISLTEALKAHLSAHLPGYMQPTLWHVVDVWPHTRNGKIHRKTLEVRVLSRTSTETVSKASSVEASENAWTQRLRETIAQALNFSAEEKAALKPETDLLSLGIHSLEMVQLSQHFTQRYGKAPGIGELLSLRTLAALASYYKSTPWPMPKTEPLLSLASGAESTAANPTLDSATLRVQLTGDALPAQHRGSQRDFQKTPLTVKMLGDLLNCLRTVSEKRNYASASGLYAVHLYVHLKHSLTTALKAGLWRYNAQSHGLILVQAGEHWPYPGVLQQDWTSHAQWGFYLIADLNTLEAQYGSDARDYALIEAGSIVQLLREQATTQMGLCLLGKNDVQALGDFFPPGVASEQCLITLMAGSLEAGEKKTETPEEEWEEWVI